MHYMHLCGLTQAKFMFSRKVTNNHLCHSKGDFRMVVMHQWPSFGDHYHKNELFRTKRGAKEP